MGPLVSGGRRVTSTSAAAGSAGGGMAGGGLAAAITARATAVSGMRTPRNGVSAELCGSRSRSRRFPRPVGRREHGSTASVSSAPALLISSARPRLARPVCPSASLRHSGPVHSHAATQIRPTALRCPTNPADWLCHRKRCTVHCTPTDSAAVASTAPVSLCACRHVLPSALSVLCRVVVLAASVRSG